VSGQGREHRSEERARSGAARGSEPAGAVSGQGREHRSEERARSGAARGSEPAGAVRRSIEVEGLHHGGAPIPLACRVGPLLISSSVLGQDPATGELPEDVAGQVALVFANIRRVLAAGGAGLEHVAKLTFSVRDRSARTAIDEHWLAAFPDPADRPARHTVPADLPPAFHVQCEVIAFVTDDRGATP
jgi:2-iminobutanoate/2-iminopropanoate deaminase